MTDPSKPKLNNKNKIWVYILAIVLIALIIIGFLLIDREDQDIKVYENKNTSHLIESLESHYSIVYQKQAVKCFVQQTS